MTHSINWNARDTKAIIGDGGHPTGDGGRWVHCTVEQVQDIFPEINFGKYCETPRCAHMLHKSAVFNAVVYPDHSDCWVSCLGCFELMLRELTGKRQKRRLFG